MDEVQLIDAASQDLLYPSESDHPFEVFSWNVGSHVINPEQVLHLAGYPPGTPIEVEDLKHFFRNTVVDEDWHDEEEKQTVRKFKKLIEVLESTLQDIKVFRVGKVQIDAYVVGRTCMGHWIGIRTNIVET